MHYLTKNHFLTNPWTKQETSEKLDDVSRKDDYTKGGLKYYDSEKYYKLFGIDRNRSIQIEVFISKLISKED